MEHLRLSKAIRFLTRLKLRADKIRSICQTGVHINNQTRCAALRRSTMLLLLHILESGKILISLDFPPAWESWEEKTRKYQIKPRNTIYKEKKVHTPAQSRWYEMWCGGKFVYFLLFSELFRRAQLLLLLSGVVCCEHSDPERVQIHSSSRWPEKITKSVL